MICAGVTGVGTAHGGRVEQRDLVLQRLQLLVQRMGGDDFVDVDVAGGGAARRGPACSS